MLLGSWLASNLEADVSNLEFDHETTPSPHENSMQPWQVPKPNAYQLGQFYATEIALWVEGVSEPSGWRIPKACQECRKRKIKCNGVNPCKTCRVRNTLCVYRDVIRQRKKKRHGPVDEGLASCESTRTELGTQQPSSPPPQPLGRRNKSASYTFHNSVSATHMTSPSCKVQLYYGPTSHFTLMHEIYRGLVSNQTTHPEEPQGEVEEAGAGLDMFSVRGIFFGTPAETHDPNKGIGTTVAPVMFMPYELARVFLQRFLSTLYHLVPFWSKELYERQLETLYLPSSGTGSDTCTNSILLMALAMGSLGTQRYRWGDILFERVKASCPSWDDVVNLETHAHYQTEQGRPNSSFLYLGTAARKAISAGLHKESPTEGGEGREMVEQRRLTFWSLFFYETWICFHLGRPSSLSSRDVGIAPPKDPFILILIHLTNVMARSANEIYGRPHDSLLQMWKLARSITEDLRCYDEKMKLALGFGLDKSPQPGDVGVQQAILTTLYYHTILLTFRPFLIFRGRWLRDTKKSPSATGPNTTKRPTEMPAWLNEACDHAVHAACRTVHHLCEAAIVNEFVRELRYHGFFLTSACFALIYDFMYNEKVATTHLPWVHVGLQCLGAMRPGDPITSSISAIQTVLKKLCPSYEWVPPGPVQGQTYAPNLTSSASATPYSNGVAPSQVNPMRETFPGGTFLGGYLPTMPNIQVNPLQSDIPEASASVVSSEDLPDFNLSDMGWDFDFSTMDLEAFFSIQPTMNPSQPL
ncbi:hypothetical protein KXW98_004322 [Aspergillus fumigatus]|nr:hypothetical protein KXX45_001350 [Aspergillus fumigatus]KAH1278117.1 hypothetical protein KXX30_004162 [Aspergillus fumigatus]KAH1289524.1 hypothetical protein KXX48_008390 [Aspergillus fumigatus]KAH1308359.1 hypothetical protein KXX66_001673 [Aspergillus fumigatus]KAH1310675.1 hypothetical protein KXX47_006205 [Aspergillus fumigatus]